MQSKEPTFCLMTKKKLKYAAASFVAKDLRPIWAPTCEGALDMCVASMQFGQTYPQASVNDFLNAMPCRNTVRSTVNEIAKNTREKISVLIRKAIETGGVSATTDTWTDDYRKATYIAVVAHLTIHNKENPEISRHRFVLSTSEITELVKSGSTEFKSFI